MTTKKSAAASAAESPSEDSESQSQFSMPTTNLIRSPRTKKKSFLSKKSGSGAASPQQAKSRGRQLQEAAIARSSTSLSGTATSPAVASSASSSAADKTKKKAPVMKIIAPSPQKKKEGPLTEHQKEVREEQRLKRKEQPSEYTSVAGTFGEDTQVDADSESGNEDSEREILPAATLNTADAALAAAGAATAKAKAKAATTDAALATPVGVAATASGAESPPTSILKRRRSGQSNSRAKARRVSFNPQLSSTHEIEALPERDGNSGSRRGGGGSSISGKSAISGRSFTGDAFGTSGGTTFLATGKPTAVPAALRQKFTSFSPPPKNNLSPGGMMMPRSRREQKLLFLAPQGRSPVPKKRASPLKVQQVDIVTPASVLFESAAARTAVKRNLALAMTPVAAAGKDAGSGSKRAAGKRPKVAPSPNTAIFPGLAQCAEQLSHVLPYFHVSNRRAVSQLLAGKKVHTVGDICSMTRDGLKGLPITVSDNTLTQLAAYQARHTKTKGYSTPSPLGRASTTSRIPRAISPDSGPLVPTMQPLEEEGQGSAVGSDGSGGAAVVAVVSAAAVVAVNRTTRSSANNVPTARAAAVKRGAAAAAARGKATAPADTAAGDLLAKSLGQHANADPSTKFAAMGKAKLTAVTGHLEKLLASARSGLA